MDRATVCGEPYPCETRRTQLLADFADAGVQFTLFRSQNFVAAAADLLDVSAQDLRARFFWYRCTS